MDYRLVQDINRFFLVFQGHTENLFLRMSKQDQKEFNEELALLKASVLNRIKTAVTP